MTAALVLACQGMALADTRIPAAAAVTDTPAVESCHRVAPEDNSAPHDWRCQAKYPSYTPAGIEFPDVTASPAIIVDGGIFRAVTTAAALADPRLARIEAPPLSILHCCLRN